MVMTKKLLLLVLLCAGFITGMSQVQFGPYLTYSGTAGTRTEKITVHFGRECTATDTVANVYYVAYWKSGGAIQVKKMDVRKKLNSKIGEIDCSQAARAADADVNWRCEFLYPKYAIYSVTLIGLDSAMKYQYMVCDAAWLAGYTYSAKSTITASDVRNASGKLLVNNASLSGSFMGTSGSVAFVTPLKVATSSFYTGSTLSIFTVQTNGIFTFTAPNTDASTATCFVTSDTQDSYWAYRKYMLNMDAWKDSAQHPNMIIHAGDFHNQVSGDLSKEYSSGAIENHLVRHTSLSAEPMAVSYGTDHALLKRTALLSSIPIQIAEGNHDVGYASNYSPDGIVSDDAQINIVEHKYTKEMIWFDKLLNYDYPGMRTKVKVTQKGVATSIDDLYSHYYSFDNGPVHFCMLDYDILYRQYSTKDTAYVAKHLRWLADDLAASTKPFKVIVEHNYGGNDGGDLSYNLPFNYKGIFTDNTARRTKDIVDAIIAKRGVSIVVSGHIHSGTDDGVSLETKSSKKFVLFDIGNSAVVNDSYYTFSFNAADNTFFWKEYGTDNKMTNHGEYILDPTQTIKPKLPAQ